MYLKLNSKKKKASNLKLLLFTNNDMLSTSHVKISEDVNS